MVYRLSRAGCKVFPTIRKPHFKTLLRRFGVRVLSKEGDPPLLAARISASPEHGDGVLRGVELFLEVPRTLFTYGFLGYTY